jgi:hypothetical protein
MDRRGNPRDSHSRKLPRSSVRVPRGVVTRVEAAKQITREDLVTGLLLVWLFVFGLTGMALHWYHGGKRED